MGITAVNSTQDNYAYQTQPALQKTASDGDSTAVEAAESNKTKAAEKMNGGAAPRAAAASTGKASSSNSDVTRIRSFANQHMSVSEIAQRLGKSVSTVMQEASAAGLNLNYSSGGTSTANTGNPAVGANINVTA